MKAICALAIGALGMSSSGAAQECLCEYGFLTSTQPYLGTFIVSFDQDTEDGVCDEAEPPCYEEGGCYILASWTFVPGDPPLGPGELDAWHVWMTPPGSGFLNLYLAGPQPGMDVVQDVSCGDGWTWELLDCGVSLQIICTACMGGE